MSKWNTTSLGEIISPAKIVKCGDNTYPVLSMTMHDGIVLQSERFKKSLASLDTSEYKVVSNGQLVVGFPIDEGVLYIQHYDFDGIMSPAYDVWNVNYSIINGDYLEYSLHSPQSMKYYESKLRGTTARRRSIPKQDLLSLSFPLPPLEIQKQIAANLDKATRTIDLCKTILEKLDLLVKSRFVEMFGDPIANPYSWEKVPLGELAEIRIGPFGTLLHKEDYITNAHALVNPSHIIDGKIVTDVKLTVSDDKYDELKAYHLYIDDVVLGRRGEMGRCAVVSENGLLCGTGSMIIRTNGVLQADYIQKILSFPSFKKTIEEMAVGQTMPNLNVPIVSNFMIICPPVEVQDSYYRFVAQIDKSKLAVKQVLEKAETLKKSLMQEYFG